MANRKIPEPGFFHNFCYS